MQKNNNKTYIALVLVVVGVIAAVFLLRTSPTDSSVEAMTHSNQMNKMKDKNTTIGNEWQWSKKDAIDHSSETIAGLPFTSDSVYRALQAVKLDENGNVILDHDALLSLDEALERIHNKLDSESLSVLLELIKKALPGKAGEQTAELVGNYYNYLQAKQEFSQINEAMADTNNELTEESIKANQELYSELQDLREVHIGNEATKTLFRISDANAQYMFDSMKLEANNDLTAEEKQQRREEIKERHIGLSINIADWPERYKTFKKQRQQILDLELGAQQQSEELETLLQKSFSHEELLRIKHLELARTQ